ncbi:unnamed protein product [Effrenium voratum]|nr:unnamed protein product [Effrenium voratum]
MHHCNGPPFPRQTAPPSLNGSRRASRTVRFALERRPRRKFVTSKCRSPRPENLTLDNSFENWDWPEKSHNERPNRLLHECHVKRLDAYLEDAVRPRLGSRLCGRFRSGEPAASL